MEQDRNILLRTLDFFGQFPQDVAAGLLSWTIGIIALAAIFASIRSVWPMSSRVFTIPLALFGVAWLSHLWVGADWIWSDWIQVIFILSTLVAIVWNALNLVRFIVNK